MTRTDLAIARIKGVEALASSLGTEHPVTVRALAELTPAVDRLLGR